MRPIAAQVAELIPGEGDLGLLPKGFQKSQEGRPGLDGEPFMGFNLGLRRLRD